MVPRGKYLGERFGEGPASEAEHFIRCPVCKKMFASEHFAGQGNVTQSEINHTECYMRKLTFGTTFFVALVAASVASAQGTVRGAQDGAAAGDRAAGPVGGVVGGAVGAATGTVGGILGVPPTTPAPDARTSTGSGRTTTEPRTPAEKR